MMSRIFILSYGYHFGSLLYLHTIYLSKNTKFKVT